MKKLLLLCLSFSTLYTLRAQTDTIPPVINLLGNNPDTIAVFEHYIEPGFVASDDHDGDLTDSVIISGVLDTGAINLLGTFWRDYTVSDSAQNITTVRRLVTVVDTIPPMIQLQGKPLMKLSLNQQYHDPFITVTDNYDMNPTVRVEGTYLNSSQKGCFYICYMASDNSGNTSEKVSRIIEVDNGCSSYDIGFCGTPTSGLVQGKIFNDKNNNCTFDGNDEIRAGGIIEAIPGNYRMNVDPQGNYSLFLHAGSYQLIYHRPRYHELASCQADTISLDIINGNTYNKINFAVNLIPGMKDATASVSSYMAWGVRTSINNNYQINYGNLGTELINNAKLILEHPPSAHLVSASPMYDQYSNNKITWNLGKLDPGTFGNISLIFRIDSSVQMNDTICFTTQIGPAESDADPSNNFSSFCQRVIGSHDPNDKQAFPAGPTPLNTKKLDYQIRFQNTGTDTAFRVIVVDTLDDLLNITEATVTSASHSYAFAVKNNILIWTFENILLPDSNVDEPASHGYVRFKVAIDGEAEIGDTILNKAFIYFDGNEPVITNTTLNIIDKESVDITSKQPKKGTLIIYPNPAGEVFFIKDSDTNMWENARLVNTYGQEVRYIKRFHSGTTEVRVGDLPQGLYLLLTGNREESYRVLILR